MPTLVFVHGSGGSSVLWQGQADALAERANTLCLDLPGHGRSDGSGMGRVEDYSRWVLDTIEMLDVPGPIPCGLSLGGAIAQQLLLDAGDRFNAGVLIGTGARLKVAPLILDSIRNDYGGFAGSMAAFAASPKTDPARLLALSEAMEVCPAETTLGDFMACNAFDVMDRLSSIRVPVLILTGEDDKLTPPKYGAFLGERIARSRRVVIPDAGHLVPFERPDVVNKAIRDFLDREGL